MITDLLTVGGEIINKIIPDPEAQAKAKIELLRLQAEGQTRDIEARMSAIVMEAKSNDPWTSRARPSFLYVFYTIIIVMTVVAPFIGMFAPEAMEAYYNGVSRGFAAMPDAMWATATMVFLGYAGARSYDKKKVIDSSLPWKK